MKVVRWLFDARADALSVTNPARIERLRYARISVAGRRRTPGD
jgi:hypothetical protein